MIRLLPGDARDVLPTLPADSVQCVVTSPPYYGLRDYGTALWDGGDAACDHQQGAMRRDGYARPTAGPERGGTFDGGDKHFAHICGKCGAVRVDRQIGLEATPDAYLATMVAVFREVRRVLRPDGTCWVNMGDSYATSSGAGAAKPRERDLPNAPTGWASRNAPTVQRTATGDCKPKDLLLMPARLALALQADGWWVRQAITWCKSNPMPESAKDRCTSATEMVYMLTKRATYFYDAIAIAEPCVSDHPSGNGYKRDPRLSYGGRGNDEQWNGIGGTRNARNWWLINTEAFPSAHFATFPSALAERCIRAGTSERGACSACGKPWGRIVEKPKPPGSVFTERRATEDGMVQSGFRDEGIFRGSGQKLQDWLNANPAVTTGWSPGCKCDAGDPVPCTVLDCFAGAGTTLLVADRLQRDAVGIELNTAYTRMAMDRCIADAPLFTSFPPAEDPEDERQRELLLEPEYGA